MITSKASVTLASISPYSQSRQHDEPRLAGESHDDYDVRTWRSKLSIGPKGTVVIPAHGMHQALMAAAKYSGKQIPGQGKKTWTAKITTGLMLIEDIDLGIKPEAVGQVAISANADGVRGSGKRVLRRFPMIPEWRSTFDIYVLDPIITKDVLKEMLEIAGMFIGIGRFRPEKGGTNGRFRLDRLGWDDGRLAAA
jgi:hypothetical protein